MEVVQVPLEAKTVKLVKKKRRPARVQIDREDLKEVSTLTPTGLIYNVCEYFLRDLQKLLYQLMASCRV